MGICKITWQKKGVWWGEKEGTVDRGRKGAVDLEVFNYIQRCAIIIE